MYVLVTGRWITWPLSPQRIPMTARHRRLVATGVLVLFVTLGLGDLYFIPGLHQVPNFMRLFELPLMLVSVGLVRLGWKLPPQPEKRYMLEGWPPPTESGRR